MQFQLVVHQCKTSALNTVFQLGHNLFFNSYFLHRMTAIAYQELWRFVLVIASDMSTGHVLTGGFKFVNQFLLNQEIQHAIN